MWSCTAVASGRATCRRRRTGAGSSAGTQLLVPAVPGALGHLDSTAGLEPGKEHSFVFEERHRFAGRSSREREPGADLDVELGDRPFDEPAVLAQSAEGGGRALGAGPCRSRPGLHDEHVARTAGPGAGPPPRVAPPPP